MSITSILTTSTTAFLGVHIFHLEYQLEILKTIWVISVNKFYVKSHMTCKLCSRETSHNDNTVLPQNISSTVVKSRDINFITN